MNPKYLIISILILLVSCTNQKTMESDEVTLTTKDGFTIKATHYPADGKAIILLHRLNQDRNSWGSFPEELQKEDYNILSLDLRGHGASQGNWKDFTDQDFNDMVNDIQAAKEYLQAKEYAIIGESIGANLAIIMGSQDKDMVAAVSLSPGYNYKGLNAKQAIMKYDQALLIVASKEDTQSFEPSLDMFDKAVGRKEFKELNHKGHGTQMFKGTDLKEEIIAWLATNYQ